MTPCSVGALLDAPSGHLGALCSRASELARLQKAINSHLPDVLRDHVVVAGLDPRTITFLTDGPARAVRLRFLAPQLLGQIRELCRLPTLQTVRVHIASPARPPEPKKPHAGISRRASEILQRSAESTSDAAIRETLLKLSRRG